MYLFAHVGIPLAALYALESRWTGGGRLDYRLLVVGALLPDLIDKAFLAPLDLGPSRGIGHTLLLTLVMGSLAGLHATFVRPALSIAVGSLSHLLLDLPWAYPETLLWPLLGPLPPRPLLPVGGYADLLLSTPLLLAGELVGLLLLALFVRRTRLWEPPRRRRFLASGRVRPPAAPSRPEPALREQGP